MCLYIYSPLTHHGKVACWYTVIVVMTKRYGKKWQGSIGLANSMQTTLHDFAVAKGSNLGVKTTLSKTESCDASQIALICAALSGSPMCRRLRHFERQPMQMCFTSFSFCCLPALPVRRSSVRRGSALRRTSRTTPLTCPAVAWRRIATISTAVPCAIHCRTLRPTKIHPVGAAAVAL
jgi:hypothetical protein